MSRTAIIKGVGRGFTEIAQGAILSGLRSLPKQVTAAVTRSINNLKSQISRAARKAIINADIVAPIAKHSKNITTKVADDIVEGSAGKVTKASAVEMVDKAIKKGGKESVEEINQAFIKKLSTEGIQLTTKKASLLTFSNALKVAAVGAGLGYGVYKVVDAHVEYEDKVDQTYKIISIRAKPRIGEKKDANTAVPETRLAAMWSNFKDSAASFAGDSQVIVVKFSPGVDLTPGDALEFGEISEEDAENNPSVQKVPTLSKPNIDGKKWVISRQVDSTTVEINLAQHSMGPLEKDVSQGSFKVWSSFMSTFVENVADDGKTVIGEFIDATANVLDGVLPALGFPSWFDGETIANFVIPVIILIIIFILTWKAYAAYRFVFGNEVNVKVSSADKTTEVD